MINHTTTRYGKPARKRCYDLRGLRRFFLFLLMLSATALAISILAISQNALNITTATGFGLEVIPEQDSGTAMAGSLSRKMAQLGSEIWKATKRFTGLDTAPDGENLSSTLGFNQIQRSGSETFLNPASVNFSGQSFDDVPPEHWAYAEIETLYRGGYVRGCSTEPMLYCPDSGLTRGEMAVFTLRGVNNAGYLPPDPEEQIFADTPLSHWAVEWATRLYEDEYSAGCSSDPLNFCTDTAHLREEAAVFALRIVHGGDYLPPEPGGIFSDVDLGTWSAKWIEQAYLEGLLDPCETEPALRFCPDTPFTRDWAAVMLVRALDLEPDPIPTPTKTIEPEYPTPTPTLPIEDPTATPTPDPSGDSNPVAVITVLNNTSEQMYDFSNTTILDTKTIRFRIDESYDPDGNNQLHDGGTYYVNIHSRRFLGCGVVWHEVDQSYAHINGRVFEVTLDEIGYYSIELTVTDNTGREGSTRFYFYTMVSPLDLGPEPTSNQPPDPDITVVNDFTGNGSRNNPFRITDDTLYFNMLSSSDPNGSLDLQQGLFAYQIDADNMHPLHAHGYTYQYMLDQNFSFDVGLIGNENEFSIDAYVIDRWGRVSLESFYFSLLPAQE
ncbi:MAG: hypothetical protein JXA25_08575 [Anaerolineales bacterium]|nr:hypothetical protein [Anaerolineales bacterium]